MNTAVTVVALLVVLPALAGLAYFYWRYRTSPAARWKHEVFRHLRNLRKHAADLHADRPTLDRELVRLADEWLTRHLDTIPVERLADFPNIGPATLSKVQDAGYRRLADVVHTRFAGLPGIGPARANDLQAAVRVMVRDAEARFNEGACAEAQEYRRRADALRAAERQRVAELRREIAAVEAAVEETSGLLPLAQAVTFWGYYQGRDIPDLTPELHDRPLPEPQRTPPPAAPPAPPPIVAHPVPMPPAPAAPAVILAEPAPRAFPTARPAARQAVSVPPADLFHAALNQLPAVPPSVGPTHTEPGAVRQAFQQWVADAVPTEHPDLARMRAVVGFGLMVAKADGRVAQAERKVIRAYLESAFGQDAVLLRNIDPLMERVEKAIPDEDAAVAAVRTATPPAEWSALYEWAGRIADASGERNAKERDALSRIAAAFGIEVAAPTPPAPTSHTVLTEVRSPRSVVVPPDSPASPEAGELLGRPRAFLRLGIAVAAACGRIGPAELAVIRDFMKWKIRRSSTSLAQLDRSVEVATRAPLAVAEAAVAVRPITNDAEKAELLALVVRITDVAGERTPAGTDAIDRVAATFALAPPPPVVAQPVSSRPISEFRDVPLQESADRAPNPTPVVEPSRIVSSGRPNEIPSVPESHHRAVLDLAPDTALAPDLIRRRFQNLTDKLDPAKAAAFGPEFARLAADKRAAVRAAAEALIAPFNEPLEKPAAPPPADLRHNPDLDDVFGA